MKTRKSATRRALAVAAGCAALAMTACSAGQISQTANQVAAVNGTNGDLGDAAVRDVSLITQEDNSVALKFNASNTGIQGNDITLESVKVQDAEVDVDTPTTLSPDCTLVADSEDAIDEMTPEGAGSGCNEYVATVVDGENFYTGAARIVTFEFSGEDFSGENTIEINAPVTAWYEEAGKTFRHQDGVTREGEDNVSGHSEGTPIH
ncbi:MAG TPA: hypothetical protein H9870_03050 [Candidatus Corynebacterium avicola]|uniref:Secreted protein n=1 Tax=Candidatus Corynebacterium avicola TaxID=2838527 RepID=A0A9D1RQ36_9CORY|nr:hypothetical protein [Candidatus Corynebacterium avicola]